MYMTSIDQESPMLPKRAEELDKIRKKLQEEFDKNPPPDKKEFKEKEAFLLGLRRGISWLDRAQQMKRDVKSADKELDTQVIFLWIGFNALYARDPQEDFGAIKEMEKYFENLLNCSEKPKDNIYKIINGVLKEKIDRLKKNKYISRNFWNWVMGRYKEWERDIQFRVWKIQSTKRILRCVFQRLYVLRNQLMHGASTWVKTENKDQLIYGAEVMHYLLPIFIEIMLRIPENEWEKWGKIWYPRVDNVSNEGKLRKSRNAPNNYRAE